MMSPSEMGTTSHQASRLPDRHLRSYDTLPSRSGDHRLIPKCVLAFSKGVPDCAPMNGRVFARGESARCLRVIVRLEIPEHETPILYKEPARKKKLLSFQATLRHQKPYSL